MIAILQPFIPHYREDFFKGLGAALSCDIFCYENEKIKTGGFEEASISVLPVGAKQFKGFLFYNPFVFTKRKYKTLVLMLNIGHLTTWILLLTKFIHRKDIVLWGHGISVKRYLKEADNPSRLMKWMIRLSDGVWFYTETEQQLWKRELPRLRSVSLNNTISDVDKLVEIPSSNKEILKARFGIRQPRILIFCARFNIAERRIDLLEKLIERIDEKKCGFVIIGEGSLKPDFSKYSHVYDFGAVYDRKLKDQLFQLADIYFQPGWVGLSVAEAMAYGKPVFSFKRSVEVLQCVEYAYISEGKTGLLFDDFESLLQTVSQIDDIALEEMGANARHFASKYLSMEHMVNSGVSLIKNQL